jgi:hypothetical protein
MIKIGINIVSTRNLVPADLSDGRMRYTISVTFSATLLVVPAEGDFLLKEDGDFLLLETGDKIIL